MALQELRTWVTRIFRSNAPQTAVQTEGFAQQARTDRAGSVVQLRTDIRQLQQEITDLGENDTDPGGASGAGKKTYDARLASLHKQLELKQSELAKFQARV